MINHRLLKITLIILILFNTNTSFAQEIFGIILDGNTNNPIEGASIYFDNTTIGTIVTRADMTSQCGTTPRHAHPTTARALIKKDAHASW